LNIVSVLCSGTLDVGPYGVFTLIDDTLGLEIVILYEEKLYSHT